MRWRRVSKILHIAAWVAMLYLLLLIAVHTSMICVVVGPGPDIMCKRQPWYLPWWS